MSDYIKKKVHLSESQISKLKSAFKNGTEVTFQIDKSKCPNYDIYLTKTQINQINNGKRITFSKTQLKKNGGFLPFLAALIPALTTAAKLAVPALATGALSGLASSAVQKKMKGNGIYQPFENTKGSGSKKKSGKGK